jgi:hypothetical protein
MPNSPTLLASLASRLATHPENIATEALLHLFRQHACARAAVVSLVKQAGMPELPALVYRSQVTGDDGSIPDIVGFDHDGRASLVLEAKFWAELTPNQPDAYLALLKPDAASLLLFVAPQSRQAVLWDKLKARLAERLPMATPVHGQHGVTWVSLGDSAFFGLTSWRTLLLSIQALAESEGDHGCRADVSQLSGLCEQMDLEAFLPLRRGELSQEVGRRVSQLADLVDAVVVELRRSPLVTTEGLTTGGAHGAYARFFRYGILGGCIQFSPMMWSQTGATPMWLYLRRFVTNKRWDAVPGMDDVLRRYALRSPTLVWEQSGSTHIGLAVPSGLEWADVVVAVAAQVSRVCQAAVSELQVAPEDAMKIKTEMTKE